MKLTSQNMKISRIAALGLVIGLSAGSLLAGEVVLSDGTKKIGRVVAKPDGSVVIATANGSFTYQKSQFKYAVGDEPPELRQGISAYRQKKLEEAQKLLGKVVRSSANLKWDGVAAEFLAKALVEDGKAVDAMREIAKIEERYGAKAFETFPSLERQKIQVIVKTKSRWGEAEKMLEAAIKSADNRERAAYAQMARGDLRYEQNKPKEAIVDYLRTVYFFSQQEEVHPEAIFKTAEMFTALQDTKRAKDFYDRLVNDYPDHPLAEQVSANQ